MSLLQFLAMLERREIITTDPAEAERCCGIPRDDDGFCDHRPGHRIYVNLGGFGLGLSRSERCTSLHPEATGHDDEPIRCVYPVGHGLVSTQDGGSYEHSDSVYAGWNE